LPKPDKLPRFEEAILPHLDAAHNLARWLMRDDADADDVVQDACLCALRFFSGFRGSGGRVWLLAIMRNTCYTELKRNRVQELATSFDGEAHGHDPDAPDPENGVAQNT
jgi:DNA-directed RNA polymerase specialized sigma24 family protein